MKTTPRITPLLTMKPLMSKEPERLKKGKEFHKQVQNTWPRGDEGDIIPEKTITKPSGRKGRIDVFVDNAGDGDLVAVVEIKDSDWDAMTPKTVRRNVGRHSNQIYDYIDSQLDEGKTVSPGIIFPKLPKDPARLKLVEELFDERGIPVVWEDETIEESKKRLSS